MSHMLTYMTFIPLAGMFVILALPRDRDELIRWTALAFTIYFRLIRTLGPVGTTSQAYLRVPIGVAIGVVFLGETLAPTTWIGFVCVIAGVAAMTLPRRETGASR